MYSNRHNGTIVFLVSNHMRIPKILAMNMAAEGFTHIIIARGEDLLSLISLHDNRHIKLIFVVMGLNNTLSGITNFDNTFTLITKLNGASIPNIIVTDDVVTDDVRNLVNPEIIRFYTCAQLNQKIVRFMKEVQSG